MYAGLLVFGASIPPSGLLWPTFCLSGLEAIYYRPTGFAFQMGQFKSSLSAYLPGDLGYVLFYLCDLVIVSKKVVVAKIMRNIAVKLSA